MRYLGKLGEARVRRHDRLNPGARGARREDGVERTEVLAALEES